MFSVARAGGLRGCGFGGAGCRPHAPCGERIMAIMREAARRDSGPRAARRDGGRRGACETAECRRSGSTARAERIPGWVGSVSARRRRCQLALRRYCSTRAVTVSRILRCCLRGSRRTSSNTFWTLADGAGALGQRGEVGADEELVDADAEGFGHHRQDVGARRLVAPLPEGDIDLSDAEKAGELGLGETDLLTQGEQMGTLLGARSSSGIGLARHVRSVRACFSGEVGQGPRTLHNKQYAA